MEKGRRKERNEVHCPTARTFLSTIEQRHEAVHTRSSTRVWMLGLDSCLLALPRSTKTRCCSHGAATIRSPIVDVSCIGCYMPSACRQIYPAESCCNLVISAMKGAEDDAGRASPIAWRHPVCQAEATHAISQVPQTSLLYMHLQGINTRKCFLIRQGRTSLPHRY